MTCKPAFEVMKKALEILSKLNESIKNDAVNCMTKAINMMNSKYQKSIELEVQIFTFAFKARFLISDILSKLQSIIYSLSFKEYSSIL